MFSLTFWKLETENSILHVFSFLHKLSFENSFCFLYILSGTGSSPVLISPVVSVFTRMTDTWQVKDPRAKKTHISFFLQHLFPFFRFSIHLSYSHISFFSSLSLALLSLSLKLFLEPFSQFPFSLQNYSPYLFRSVITFCFCFCGWAGF